ncbi:cobyric acid synthase [Clostridium polynesiense]|uniref:cobyric acid synthase n=1 Tax=Clostridium polynesiense TaxID=1325933 RepID=UPI00058E0E12|nr:cobyric acid synthase [Clostridium polynesiense]
MAKIMIQGTASSVGKSLLTAALCRIFMQDGYSVCPYKSQNMSLNSYITLDGKEMGRAQVLQAYAAGLEPQSYMNPILLKPSSDTKSQVIVNGKVYGNYNAEEYHNLKPQFKEMLKGQFQELEKSFDIIVIEGAGSPAEINLRDKDIVNMGLADLIDAPVLLVGDIDKGGVFAALAGTMLLLNQEEKARVKGTIINKFRGDKKLLQPGIDSIEDIIQTPCLGVVPYFTHILEDEDGSRMEINRRVNAPIDIAVLMLPHISNFTDVDALRTEEDVSVRFIYTKEEFGKPDLLIIPGSKNTIADLITIRNAGLEEKIKSYSSSGFIIGICGGYQMLGRTIEDPLKVESSNISIEGLGLLNITTALEAEKVMTRVKGEFSHMGSSGRIYGYEIHMGTTIKEPGLRNFITLSEIKGGSSGELKSDGTFNERGNVIGSYIHGIFDSTDFREYILNRIRKDKGLKLKASKPYESIRDDEINKLADIVRENVDIDAIYGIMGIK